jgi:hypothetical protein
MKIKLLILTICSIIFSKCINISQFDRGTYIPATAESTVIEFETAAGLLIINAEINGVTGRFLFDNGFSLSGINPDFAERAHISFDKQGNLKDANNNRSVNPETTVDSVIIAGHAFLNTGFYQINTNNFMPCNQIDGVIGASIINKTNWQINFGQNKIQISSTPFHNSGYELDIMYSNNNSAFTELSIQGVLYKCKIDLGSTKGIQLKSNYVMGSLDGLLIEKRIGIMSLSSNGVGKMDTTYHTKDSLLIMQGDASLPQKARVLIKENLKYAGYIGTSYLSNYTVSLNSTARKYILKRANTTQTKNSDASYGLAIYPIEDKWKIVQFNPNDSLLTGINLLSEVIMVDNVPMIDFNSICDYKNYMRNKIEHKESIVFGLNEAPRRIELTLHQPQYEEYQYIVNNKAH